MGGPGYKRAAVSRRPAASGARASAPDYSRRVRALGPSTPRPARRTDRARAPARARGARYIRGVHLIIHKILIRARPRRRRVRARACQDARMLAMMALAPELLLLL